MTSTDRKRTYLSFGIRTMLIVTTFVAVLLGVWVGPALRQQRAVELYEQLGLACAYEEPNNWVPNNWVRKYVHFFCKLESVDGKPVNAAVADKVFLAKIPAGFSNDSIAEFLPKLRTVQMADMSFTGFLPKLKELEVLSIEDPNGKTLPDLPQVSTLMFGYCKNRKINCGLARHCRNAKMLVLHGDIENADQIAFLTGLEKMFVGSYGVAPTAMDLEPLANLKQLKQVRLNIETCPDLQPLQSCEKLEILELIRCREHKRELSLAPVLDLPALKDVKLRGPLASDSRFGLTEAQFASKGFTIHENE